MPARRIVDSSGTAWEVWEVDTAKVAATPVPSGATGNTLIPRLPGSMQSGWLAARSEAERRRIAPVPNDWAFMTDAQLRQLLERAKPIVVSDERAPLPAQAPAAAAAERRIPGNSRVPVRSFNDIVGQRWDVWEAHPSLRERRAALSDRRELPRETPERRTEEVGGFAPGWLVFRHGAVRYRLHVIPDGWFDLPEPDLRMLLATAARPRDTQRWSD